MTNWSTVNKERHHWKYRVHVEYLSGNAINYVNRYYDSFEEAEAYQERMLLKEYVERVTLTDLTEENSNDRR